MTGYLYYVAMSEMRRQMEGALVGSGPGPAIPDERSQRISRTSLFARVRRLAATGVARVFAGSGGTGAGKRTAQPIGAANRGCGS